MNILIEVNNVLLKVTQEESRIIVKPITTFENIKEYHFSMPKYYTTEYFLKKLEDISLGLNEMKRICLKKNE